jgi:hypothetical protein
MVSTIMALVPGGTSASKREKQTHCPGNAFAGRPGDPGIIHGAQRPNAGPRAVLRRPGQEFVHLCPRYYPPPPPWLLRKMLPGLHGDMAIGAVLKRGQTWYPLPRLPHGKPICPSNSLECSFCTKIWRKQCRNFLYHVPYPLKKTWPGRKIPDTR